MCCGRRARSGFLQTLCAACQRRRDRRWIRMRAGAPALRSWCRCLILGSRVARVPAGDSVWDGSQT
eukprot:4549028-Heterocapsa_arctica.AAC.1